MSHCCIYLVFLWIVFAYICLYFFCICCKINGGCASIIRHFWIVFALYVCLYFSCISTFYHLFAFVCELFLDVSFKSISQWKMDYCLSKLFHTSSSMMIISTLRSPVHLLGIFPCTTKYIELAPLSLTRALFVHFFMAGIIALHLTTAIKSSFLRTVSKMCFIFFSE